MTNHCDNLGQRIHTYDLVLDLIPKASSHIKYLGRVVRFTPHGVQIRKIFRGKESSYTTFRKPEKLVVVNQLVDQKGQVKINEQESVKDNESDSYFY